MQNEEQANATLAQYKTDLDTLVSQHGQLTIQIHRLQGAVAAMEALLAAEAPPAD